MDDSKKDPKKTFNSESLPLDAPEKTVSMDTNEASDGLIDMELELDEDVVEMLEAMAAKRGCTVDKVIQEAFEAAIQRASRQED